MEEDNSNDVVLIENTEDNSKPLSCDSDLRPLMMLFERLISNDSKSNTVLTNSQILLILSNEFNMDVSNLHDLEVDIYINIVKKFLKDWPQWDVFDRDINKLKKQAAQDKMKVILEQKYIHLKEYLKSMIETATPLAKETVAKYKNKESKKKGLDPNLVLEVYCTRRMLNKCFYNKPNPSENNTLFHLMEYEPYEANDKTPHYTLSSILHWYGVKLYIELPNLIYTMFMSHQLNHLLINDNNLSRKLNQKLDTSVYISNSNNKTNSINISKILKYLDKILNYYRGKEEFEMIEEVFSVVKSDLDFDSTTVEVPGTYKQQLNRYPYVRKLFKDIKGTSTDNIYIEETVIPMQNWHIAKYVDDNESCVPESQPWMKFECVECKQKFHLTEFLTGLIEHFGIYHADEPDWSCTNCGKTFSMAKLTKLGWRHECIGNKER